MLELLEKLKDDPAEYVRRSVANNLNDISKDHPGVVSQVARLWSNGAKGTSPERQWLIRHALRTLVKAGHPGALRVLGYDPAARLEVEDFRITPEKLKLGEDLNISFRIVSRTKGPQNLVVDYAVHFARQNGGQGGKVFKLKNVVLQPGERLRMQKTHKFRRITTRRYHTGRHGIEILINGTSCAKYEFHLTA